MNWKILLLAVMLISCNNEKSQLNFVQKRAENFLDEHAENFLSNKDLLYYGYNPRGQFFHSEKGQNEYRVFQRDEELIVICFSEKCSYNEMFLDSTLTLPKGKYRFKPDSIGTEVSRDTIEFKKYSFKIDPVQYFKLKKEEIQEYGVFGIYPTEEFIQVFLTSKYYLIYSKKNKIEDLLIRDKLVRDYNNGWFFIEAERPLDQG